MVNLVFTGDIVTLHIKISDHLPLKLFGEAESIGYIAGQKRFGGETILANICKFDTELRGYLDISKRNTQDEVIFFQEVSTEISAFESIISSVNLLYAFGRDIPVAACFCRDKPNPTFEKKKKRQFVGLPRMAVFH